MVMQVLVIAVQNAVDYRDLGVATSGATLFRLVGGSLGTALLGAVFGARLEMNLRASAFVLGGAARGAAMNVHQLSQLPPAARAAYMNAFTGSLDTVFTLAAIICAVGFLLTLLLPEQPLRRTVAATASNTGEEVAETFARPMAPDSELELRRGLQLIASRDVQRAHIESIVQRAGLSISPGAAWLLVHIDRERNLDFDQLARRHEVARDRIDALRHELEERRWIEKASRGDGYAVSSWRLTALGREALAKLVEARRAHLAEVLSDWPEKQREEIAARLRSLAEVLVPAAGEEPR
jgi:DNA-binding MarR family transcriptional regulator